MRLVFDIGNTTVHAGLVARREIVREQRFVAGDRSEFGSFLDRFLKGTRSRVHEIGIVSVAPSVQERVEAAVASFGVPVRVAGRDVPIPLATAYHDPRRIGVDRLVDAWSARRRFGGAWIVVNFGTAVTIDAVADPSPADAGDDSGAVVCGAFHSGAIVPGLWMSLQGLARGAAQLPSVESADAREFPTRSTEEAMVAGVSVGLAGLVDRVGERLAAAVGIAPRAVATGGDARRLCDECKIVEHVVPGLTLLGVDELLDEAPIGDDAGSRGAASDATSSSGTDAP